MLKAFYISAVIVLSACFTSINAGEEPAPAPAIDKATSDKLAAIIKKLNSNDYRERRTGGNELVKLAMEVGKPLEESLKEYLKDAGAEAKIAIERQLACIKAPELREYWDVISMFDALNMPDVIKLKFVCFNAGLDASPIYYEGWIISETNASITIFMDDFEIREFSKKPMYSANAETENNAAIKGLPMPGKYVGMEWDKFAAQILTNGEEDAFGRKHQHIVNDFNPFVRIALYGYVTYLRGDSKTAFELLQKAEAMACGEIYKPNLSDDEEYTISSEYIQHCLHTTIRCSAICTANNGASFGELISKWRIIYSISIANEAKEAEDNLKFYGNMLAEEKIRIVPTKEELEKMSADKKVEYWIYHLRDLNVCQREWPGYCDVLSEFWDADAGNKPAGQLAKIGWDALPAVIEHIDDRRPTRSVAFARPWNIESFYLLRYGDACQQIFEEITGVEIYKVTSTVGYMIKDGTEAESKKKAKEWWARFGGLGPEKYYTLLLSSGIPKEQKRGAAGLIGIGSKKYLPELVKFVEKSPVDDCTQIIGVLAGKLDNSYEAFYKRCLRIQDFWTCCRVAEALLENCASEAGAIELYRRLYDFNEEKFREFGFFPDYAFEIIARTPGDFSVAAIEVLMNSPIIVKRFYAVEAASKMFDNRILRALLKILDDKATTNPHSGGKERLCDAAAAAILELISYENPNAKDTATPDKFISELKKYISENIGKFDWEKLKAKSVERWKEFYAPDQK
jgi:hypothetical protein